MTLADLKKDALLIFQKNMILGKAKTRIAASIGDKKALEIYKKLVQFTHQIISNSDSHKFIFFSNHLENELLYEADYFLKIQKGNSLGDRMIDALRTIFSAGYGKAILIGTDCGEINEDILEKAFSSLNHSDVVLGPAEDGGYYLIGMKALNPLLFQGIDWSTDKVLSQTIQIIENEGLMVDLLPVLADVDTYKDWQAQKERVEFLLK